MKPTPIALWLFGMIASECQACSCEAPSVTWALRESAAVFAGKVISVKSEAEHSSKLYHWLKHRIRIEKSWKGAPAGRVETVYTDSGPCGIGFLKGSDVIIYASRIKEGPHLGALTTWLCSRSSAYPHIIAAECDSLGRPQP